MKRILLPASPVTSLATSLAAACILAACGGGSHDVDGTAAQFLQAAPRAKAAAPVHVAADYQDTVQYLYLAYFGRPADPAGLVNFENALLAANVAPGVDALSQAYATNTQVKTLIDSFGTSKESQTLYGGGNSSAFVTAVFENVLGRAPASSGLAFWSGAIDSGSLSTGKAALAILDGALTNTTAQGLLDAQLITQRLGIAESFTAQVSLQGATGAYSGASAAAAARSMLGTVTATTDPVLFSTSIDSTLGTLLGPSIELLAGSAGGPGANDGNVGVAHFATGGGTAGVWADAAGNLLVADSGNNTVRKITPGGMVSTIAGNANLYAAGATTLSKPSAAVSDAQGNVYVANGMNLTKVVPGGASFNLASGFGVTVQIAGVGPFVSGTLSGMAIDAAGNIYLAESYGNSIYKVTPDGKYSVLAGTPSTSGGAADGTGAAASFNSPQGMTIDGAGNLYVADSRNGTIRKITPAGVVTTLQGSFSNPTGVALDAAGNVYVTETGINVVSVLGINGVKTTLAGQATSNTPNVTGGFTDGTGSAAQFKLPEGITIGADGNIYVVDAGNDAIRKITPAGVVTTLSGAPPSLTWADGTGPKASFMNPFGVIVDGSGNLYVTDFIGDAVRKITPAGVTTTLAGTPGVNENTYLRTPHSGPTMPGGLAMDANGNIFYADANGINKIAPDGTVSSYITNLQTNAISPGSFIGLPAQMAIDKSGNFYLSDTVGGYLHKLTPEGVLTKVTGAQGYNPFFYSSGVVLDAAGNIYAADSYNSYIVKLTPDGTVTILAGAYQVTGYADGIGSNAKFNTPSCLALDAAGNVYVADVGNNAIRKITPAGVVTTVIGKGGVAGNVLGALPGGLSAPEGIAIDKNGIMYVTSGYGVFKVKLP